MLGKEGVVRNSLKSRFTRSLSLLLLISDSFHRTPTYSLSQYQRKKLTEMGKSFFSRIFQMRKTVLVLTCVLTVLPVRLAPSSATASNTCLALSDQQYLEASSQLIPLGGDFTLEFDFLLTKDSKSNAEIMSQGGQPNAFYLGVDPELRIRAGDAWIDTGTTMTVKKWTHFALTRSASGRVILYVNGKPASMTQNYQLNNTGTNTRIGAQFDASAGERINGCIDNLMIWKTVRSADEVARDALVTSYFADPSLIAFYDFNSAGVGGLIESSVGPGASLKPLIAPEFFPSDNPVPEFSVDLLPGEGLKGFDDPSGGLGFYMEANLRTPIPDNFRSGFGWYSTAWSISPSQVDDFQLGLSSTWIIPDNRTLDAATSRRLCDGGTVEYLNDEASNSDTYGQYIFQTIEGSLGWWRGEKFRTVFPKYMPNVSQNCYSSEVATPGWGFFNSEPTARADTGMIQISNQILMPPDGLTLTAEDTGPQLGVTWHSLNLPRFDHAFGSEAGDNSWTLFMNSQNFKGPVAFIAPQFWVDGSSKSPAQRNLTLDKRPGHVNGLASEWGSIPLYKHTGSDGTITTKIPELQFPVDSNGDFVISRDFTSYSEKAISSDFEAALAGAANLPTMPANTQTDDQILVGTSSEVYQEGKLLDGLTKTLTANSLDNGNAYGFSVPDKTGMVTLPQYFLDSRSARTEISESEAPTKLSKASFNSAPSTSTFVYQYPSWWDASPTASEDFTTQLNDGSTAVYRWYKFVDQPALQRFELNESEKSNLQSAVVKMQKDWAQTAMMADPSKGSLVSFDSGLLTSPPPGLEFGYVPIVIKQFMEPGSTATTTPKPTATTAPVTTLKPTDSTAPAETSTPATTSTPAETSKSTAVVAALVALLLFVAVGLKVRKSRK